ncbi:MAG: hypothetical protein AAB426_13545 [Myxococcota bacterium]
MKWRGPYIIIGAKYVSPDPRATAAGFDAPLARLGYFASGHFSLWARRHTEEWIVIADDLTLDHCLEQLRTNPWFER